MEENNFDISLLHTSHTTAGFYEQHGWLCLPESTKTVAITNGTQQIDPLPIHKITIQTPGGLKELTMEKKKFNELKPDHQQQLRDLYTRYPLTPDYCSLVGHLDVITEHWKEIKNIGRLGSLQTFLKKVGLSSGMRAETEMITKYWVTFLSRFRESQRTYQWRR